MIEPVPRVPNPLFDMARDKTTLMRTVDFLTCQILAREWHALTREAEKLNGVRALCRVGFGTRLARAPIPASARQRQPACRANPPLRGWHAGTRKGWHGLRRPVCGE
jgi:hypothetical protein